MIEDNNRRIFNNKYIFHGWGFGSGTGAIFILNKPFVEFTNQFLESHSDINTVVDIGCGDWQIGRHLNLGNKKYIGCDVSDYILKKTKAKFASANREFLHIDAVNDELPKGDLVILKEVLQHLCNRDACRILSKISVFPHVIIQSSIYDNYDRQKFLPSSTDIRNGEFRPFNITQFDNRYKLVKKYNGGVDYPANVLRKIFFLPSICKGIFVNKK
ncbi:MAG: class I SAM-dependent methyltransferase [Patescibacteria group bacterium]